jgi:hypothetical protein
MRSKLNVLVLSQFSNPIFMYRRAQSSLKSDSMNILYNQKHYITVKSINYFYA